MIRTLLLVPLLLALFAGWVSASEQAAAGEPTDPPVELSEEDREVVEMLELLELLEMLTEMESLKTLEVSQ